MNHPKELDINQDFSVKSKIQRGKVIVTVLDGVNGAAYEAEVPEHGKTIIDTAKGDFSRIKLESSYRFK